MADLSLLERERAIERSRAKLTQDLAALCSPDTFAAFGEDLKRQALNTKDDLWENVKARAAANPAAVIAIATGLAWRVIQRPPIASALVAFGLFSLWKTEGKKSSGVHGQSDFIQESMQALKEQAGEFVTAASGIAGQAQEAVAAKGSEVWEGAKEQMRDWTEGVAAPESASRPKSTDGAILYNDRQKQRHLWDGVRDLSAAAVQNVGNDDTRNKVLLGVAGVAIAGALGIACQKRISSTE